MAAPSIGSILALTLLGSAAAAQARPDGIEFSGPPGSGKPHLSATLGGELLLTWFEPRPNERAALRIAARFGGRWSDPRTVGETASFFVNWADFPSAVATSLGHWVVHWLEKTESKPYAYHVMLAISRDRGLTWSGPIVPHSDRSLTEHGFVAMVPDANGNVDLIWLDGRQFAGEGQGPMTIRYATVRPDGGVHGETLLDAMTCECCQTAVARARAGLVAVYRDRTPEEVRDIAVVRELGGRWTEPRLVASDGWVWRACPVNGPSIAANQERVVVAWYTAASNQARVKVALSVDGGGTFRPPVVVDEGKPIGRAEVEQLPDGSAVVVWLEAKGDRAEWRGRRITADGRAGPAWIVAATLPARDAGFVRAAATSEALFVAWTAPETPGSRGSGGVRVRRIPLSGIGW